jgi:hypothetical protein
MSWSKCLGTVRGEGGRGYNINKLNDWHEVDEAVLKNLKEDEREEHERIRSMFVVDDRYEEEVL